MKYILFLSNFTKNLIPNKNKILSTFLSHFCFLACVCIIIAKADVNLIMEQDINFSSKKGTFGGKMSYKDQAWQAIGSFQVNAENKVRFQINQVNVGGRFYNLKQKPVIVRQLKSPNAILRKGSNLVLKNENQAEFDEFYARVNDTAYAKQEEKTKQKRKARTLSSVLSNGSANSGSGTTGMSIGTSSGSGSLPYYMPSTIGTSNDSGNGKITTYTTQFCKAPEYLHNAIKLSIVDKDGNCIDRLAVRDDTKCEYRFDFANSKAIKQTQFYYVDNENKVQVVGDCVDLQGAEYQSTLYKDDTRCSLESTDKNYGGGTASFFVTQILFRGIDGLIHNATDCMAYGNIKEELVKYEHNDKAKQSQRIVNQYYTDYYTGERVYITQGVKTDKAFDWKETACGEWAKSLSLEKANLERELKNKQIYLNNVSKKIESTLSQGKNPTSLIAKKDLLKDEIQTLQVKISYTSHDISEINKGFKQLFDSNESFKDFTKHFNSFHKKKALLSSFNGFEKYLSKDLITKLNYIKAEVSQSQFALNQHFQTLQSSIYTMLKSNQQSNTYTLSKNFYKLKRYKSIVRALEFSDSTSQANKSKALLDLTQIEQELRALILQRMEFLRLEIANSKANFKLL